MQIGIITVDGAQVGIVSWTSGEEAEDPFVPNLDGYVPEGRAAERSLGDAPAGGPSAGHHHYPGHHTGGHQAATHQRFGGEGDTDAPPRRGGYQPRGETYHGEGGHPVTQGSAETDQAIVDASRAHHLDPNTMRSIASIESSMNPSSNAHRATQYKGLYQIGHDEWRRFGAGGNIYSARDNAFAAARMFEANRDQFHARYGRDPTDTELYLMHQQGLGFYTRGAMTNIGGNPYPGMRGAQTHESFEAGWGREVARRKAGFAARNPNTAAAEPPADVTFDPETMAP